MTARKVVVVTGANRGIGLAICEAILANHFPVKLYACSRAGKDLGLNPTKSAEVAYPTLDIKQQNSVDSLFETIKSADGHLDILINNAGLNKSDASSAEDAREIMSINYHGTSSTCQTFLPLLKTKQRGNDRDESSPRIVNVSSTASSLQGYHADLQSKFRSPSLQISDIDSLANGYIGALTTGSHLGDWGNKQVYSVSKACVNALTAVLARENPDVVINCCCPGWVDTEMGQIVGQPPKTVEEGARIPVRLAFGDLGGVSGRYWGNPGVYDTGYGDVQEW